LFDKIHLRLRTHLPHPPGAVKGLVGLLVDRQLELIQLTQLLLVQLSVLSRRHSFWNKLCKFISFYPLKRLYAYIYIYSRESSTLNKELNILWNKKWISFSDLLTFLKEQAKIFWQFLHFFAFFARLTVNRSKSFLYIIKLCSHIYIIQGVPHHIRPRTGLNYYFRD